MCMHFLVVFVIKNYQYMVVNHLKSINEFVFLLYELYIFGNMHGCLMKHNDSVV